MHRTRSETKFMRSPVEIRDEDVEKGYVGDTSEFRFLFDFLKAHGWVTPEPELDWKLRSKIDKLLWRAGDSPLGKQGGAPLSLMGIYHHALHYLLALRFGENPKGMPRACLLFEALASCTDFYFFALAHRLQIPGKLADGLLEDYRTTHRQLFDGDSEAADARLIELVGEAIRDPFRAYRECVFEMFEYVSELNEALARRIKGAPFDFERLLRKAKRTKYGCFFFPYDLSGHVYYARTHCGTVSTRADRAAVAECVRDLRRSADFLEFVESLERGRRARPAVRRASPKKTVAKRSR